MPRSLGEVVQRNAACVVPAAVSSVVTAELVGLLNNLALWCAAGLLLLAGGEVLARRSSWSWLVRSAQAGVLVTYVLAGVAALAAVATGWR